LIQTPHLLAQEPAAAALPKGTPRPWWEGRPFVAAMILLAFVPLLYPQIPPLVADTAEAFAASVVRLLTDDTLAMRLSRCGRDLVHRRYSEAVVGRQTLAVLNHHRRLFTSARLSS